MATAAQKMVSRLGVSAAMVRLLERVGHQTVRVVGGKRLTEFDKSLRRLFAGLRERGEQPGAGDGPVALRGGLRDAQTRGGVLQRQARVVAEPDELRLARLLGGEAGEGVIEREEIVAGVEDGERLVQVDPLAVAAVL